MAYFSIPVILFYLIKKSKNHLPFQKIFWLFILFILSCGVTHVFDALMFWFPVYRMSALVLFVTAITSWMAVYGLYKIIPSALALKSPAVLEKIIQERTLELQVSNNHLQQLNSELTLAKLESEKLMKQKEEFLGIASHELKTPLTILKAYTQLLSEKTDGEKITQTDIQNKMRVQIDRLALLIYDLLDVTKIKEGMLVYYKKRVNLKHIITDVVQDIRHTSLSNNIILENIVDIEIIADRERIAQVFLNLLSNAMKYSPAGSPIIITVQKEEHTIICAVKDQGFGIPQDQQDKIFEKFYRATGGHRDTYPGMGLGLHIAENIITNHEGTIWVESEEGKGSTFYFQLPIASEDSYLN
nr:HAMP domain-containing sensor histidine kinase [Panacibacter ginsenosidivorans]